MNNIENLMRELVNSSVLLKRQLYRRDNAASTSPEGTEGPRVAVHACLVCNRAAAGNEAQVCHKSDCPLAKMQRAQKALREAWPELFTKKPVPDALPAGCAKQQGSLDMCKEETFNSILGGNHDA
jgi:hypothetical protein